MNGHGTNALQLWRRFLSQAFVKRLDPDKFAALVPLQQSRSPLSPTLIADLLLRPDPKNSYAPDTLVPGYLDVLLKQNIITAPAVLFALAKYSSVRPQATENAGDNMDEGEAAKTAEKRSKRWANSYTIEQVIFLRLAKAVKHGTAIRTMKDAVDVVRLSIRWMSLFSDMSAAFASDVMGAMYSHNVKIEVECSRSAFVMLLSSICEVPTILTVLSGASAKSKPSNTVQPSQQTPVLTYLTRRPQTTLRRP